MNELKVCFVKHGLETNTKEILSSCNKFLSELSIACGFDVLIGTVQDV